ncbi:MAG: transposase [Synechococcus sp. SB0662_bin_45]|nr:transposase [Synechococcus sp. SB0668_bin_13]MXX08370.1 transposase [Synechococcus sp. SB0667_bin_8]MYE21257.1 transposase [Synechococcus sp. SB0662_bin_45]MYG63920.1 transposase [Synechococcus sp. SB0675_bin_7]MYI71024.1 transposase [Synechococcus sp. SB0673_bin_10]MYK07867.1 transposase [Synechococcus sp. SB0670_bin_20]MYK85117.1 transposase [Synechococcus sp. SB0669_bin_7]
MSRVDESKVLSGIIYVLHHGPRWVDAPAVYRPHKTLYNRFRRWSEKPAPQPPPQRADPCPPRG